MIALDCAGKAWIDAYNGITWLGWIPIATATPPQEYVFSCSDGFTDNGGSWYCKSQDGFVFVNLLLKADTTKEPSSSGYIIGTLPEGFRPPTAISTPMLFDTGDMGGRKSGRLSIRTNGQVVAVNADVSWDRCFGCVTFVSTG